MPNYKRKNGKPQLDVDGMAAAMDELENSDGYRLKKYGGKRDKDAKGEKISSAVSVVKNGIENVIEIGPVDLYNAEQVQERTKQYLEACRLSSTIPSISGLAVFGLAQTRQNLRRFCVEHPEHQTAQFIGLLKEAIASLLIDGGLKSDLNPVMSIFTLCNGHDYQQKVTTAVEDNVSPLGTPQLTPEQIAEKYKNILGE